MPGAVKPPPARPDFVLDFTTPEPETKVPIKNMHSPVKAKTNEGGSRGAGETVAKKVKKVTKPNEEKTVKKVCAPASDKVPKKIAPRARAVTSANRTPEKGSLDSVEKPKPVSKVKVPRMKEEAAQEQLPATNIRKVSDDTTDKKPRSQLRKPRTKIAKRLPNVTSQIVAPAVTQVKPPETPIIETPIAEGPENEPPPVEDTIQVVNEEPQSPATTTSSSHGLSCSFFEKLQLGVKAYFNSRNSFISSDKNKKEGGKQTRARVRKGIKEEAPKNDGGNHFKNNICISESDMLLDPLRLYAILGGGSSNFLTNTPNISKSKKLNQIPRKGYFYRSTMQYEIPQQPPSSPLELLEPCVRPKNKSKIQISGLAPTGSEIPRVPVQKRVKKKRQSSEEVYSDADSFSGTPPRLSSPKSLAEYDFNDDRFLSGRSGKNKFITDLFPKCGERPMSRSDGQKRRKKTPTSAVRDFSQVLESKPATFETLTSCISSVLGEDELIQNLEITAVNPEDHGNIPEESTKPLITPVTSDYMTSGSLDGGLNPTAVLMGEIDLHLELQNYLKAFNSFSVSKSRTKNTLHSNNQIKLDEFRVEEFEGDEKTPSVPPHHEEPPNNYFFDDLEEERVESRLAPSQTHLSYILRQMQKTNSTQRGFLSDNWMDSYEKVLPLGSGPPRGFNSAIYSSGESALGTLWTDSTPKTQAQPLNPPFNIIEMIDIYKNMLKEYDKLIRRGRKGVGGCLSNRLISFLQEKVTEKHSRANLSSFSKQVSNRYGWRSPPRKVKAVYVLEYVDLYQKILKSSMPMRLITHLNSIISNWETRSEYYIRNLKKRLEKSKELAEQRRMKSAEQEMSTAVEKFPSLEDMSTPSLTTFRQKPKNLQMMLESFFNSEGEDLSGLSNLKGKVLVDVKLAGDQIRVNDLSFVKNRVPPRKKTDTDEEASELIIETVGKSEITDVLCERPTTRRKKPVKKRTKPKRIVNKNGEDSEGQKTTPEFEYNEIQLRTQHPIGPISENSEAKIYEGKNKKIVEKTPYLDLLRKALESDILLKDLLNNEAVEELLGTKPNLRKLPLLLKTRFPKTVRSLIDLKSKSAMWRKIHKSPSAWSRTFFCFQPEENQNKKEKKFNNMTKIHKKMQDFAMQRLKPRAAILRPNTPISDSVAFVSNDRLSDSCSMDLLFSDKKSTGGVKPKSGSMMNLIKDEEPGFSKNSILLHKSNPSADGSSFSLDLVHSDSFLKRFSQTSILERDTKILFKNSSDIKFSPNRIVDGKKEQKPFVTFCLTPEQMEKASVSAEDAVGILKKPFVKPVKSPTESDDAKTQEKLKSIDKFLETLHAQSRRRKKKLKMKPTETKCNPPIFSERKPNTRCQTCQLLSMKDPQKRKKTPKLTSFDSKSTIKSDKPPAKKVKSDIRKPVVPEVAKDTPKPVVEVKKSEEKKSEKVEKQEAEEKKGGDLSKISLNLEDIPLELLGALKDTISQVENLKKKKSNAKIEEGVRKKFVEKEKAETDKTPKSFVLKIYCEKRGGSTKVEDIKSVEVQSKQDAKDVEVKEEKELKAIEEVKEQEVEVEEDFKFFDAIEKNLKEEKGKTAEEKKKSTKKPRTPVSPAPKDKRRPPTPITENRPLPATPPREKPEEIFSKISDSLIEGQITYSLLLLDSFIKKKHKFLPEKDQPSKPLENNTGNHMTSLEKNAWIKILSILNFLSQIMDKNGEENLKAHLQSTKAVVQEILQLNISRLDDLQKFNTSVTQFASENENDAFDAVRECLKNLKNRETEHKEKNDSEKREEKENDSSEILSEIQGMNSKLVEDLKSLEKLFSVSESNKGCCSEEEGTVSEAAGVTTENADMGSGCSQLIQCLMKAWNTRMSLNTYPNDVFR